MRAERLFLHDAPAADAGATSHAGDATFLEVDPAPSLRSFVRRIGICHERIGPGRVVEERVVPDGALRIAFNFADRPEEVGSGAGFAAEVIGPSATAARVRMWGTIDGLTVELRAGAAAAVLGVPAGELAGRVVELEALWGALAADVHERLAAAPGVPARLAIVEEALSSLLARRGGAPHTAAAHAAALIEASGGRLRVAELAARLGVGERRLEQIFHHHVGLSPKRLARVARARAAARLLRSQPQRGGSDVALDCGYYDQAHLINDLRAIVGLTPTELARTRVAGFSKTVG